MSDTLECYSCSGGEKCGKLFSPNATAVTIIKPKRNETLRSCSVRMNISRIDMRKKRFSPFFFLQISVTPEGLTTRSMVPSHECRSSSYQFCCNENLCNNLLSPPLPAFTSLRCAIGKCRMSNGICIYDAAYIATLSSPTESCSVSKKISICKTEHYVCR